jgi:hypothetical protein
LEHEKSKSVITSHLALSTFLFGLARAKSILARDSRKGTTWATSPVDSE